MPPHTPDGSPALRNTALSDALQTGDVAAVAFALRHGPTVVPVPPPGADGGPGADAVTTTDPETGAAVLLLFSDAEAVPAAMRAGIALRTPGWLRAFLGLYEDDLAAVIFDVAGPHPMRAAPADLIAALDA